MTLRLALIALAACLAGPVACGQRGPLYLPDETVPEAPREEQATTESEDDAATP